jgi:hypothetical protein
VGDRHFVAGPLLALSVPLATTLLAQPRRVDVEVVRDGIAQRLRRDELFQDFAPALGQRASS